MGSANIKHPIITFAVNLPADKITILHPDRHQTDQDLAITQAAEHDSLKSAWLPGLTAAENVKLKQDGQFTAYGLRANYLKAEFVTKLGYLTIIEETFASE
jgi:hypothetical protein